MEEDKFEEKRKHLRVRLITPVAIHEKNRVYFGIEHRKKEMILEPGRNYMTRFKKIDGLKMKNKYTKLGSGIERALLAYWRTPSQ